MAVIRFNIPCPEAEGGGFVERYWSITHSPVLNENGEVLWVLQYPIDVTELQHLQDAIEHNGLGSALNITPSQSGIFSRARSVYESNLALQEERDRLSAMFVQAPSFMAMLRGREHRIELANPAFMRLAGHRPILGRTVAEALPEAVKQGYLDLLNKVFNSGEAYTANNASYAVQAPPGGPTSECFIDFVYQPIKDSKGQVTGIFVEGVDTTDRVLSDLALRESKERLSALVSASSEVLYSMSADWSEMRQLTGSGFLADTSTANPSWLTDYIPPDEQLRVMAAIQESIRTKGIFHLEHKVRRASGDVGWTVSRAVPLLNAAGVIMEWFGAASDITARREAEEALRLLNETLEEQVRERTQHLMAVEEALRHSQKMEAVGQLTGGVAHDFNNLLTVIRSSADLLRRANLPEERRQRYIEAISDTANRAAKLTGQLLAFARRQPLKPEVFVVGERVQAVTDLIRPLVGACIAIETRIECDGCAVEADPSQFETALVNLAVNARDAMEGGGRLFFRTWLVSKLPPIRGHAGARGEFMAVSVSDTGAGIEPDLMGRIFEPFFTTKEVGKGTGLGLSQVYGFAKQSGGELQVESEMSRGTTFTLYLPRVTAKPQGEHRTSDLESGNLEAGRRNILLVEDNTQVGDFARQLLDDLGYTTTWAPNAQAALQILEEDAGYFDTVFSDVVMPGMNGVELGEEIRRRWPKLRVILTSGYSHVLATGGTRGFPLLQKPYSVEGLFRTLRSDR